MVVEDIEDIEDIEYMVIEVSCHLGECVFSKCNPLRYFFIVFAICCYMREP